MESTITIRIDKATKDKLEATASPAPASIPRTTTTETGKVLHGHGTIHTC